MTPVITPDYGAMLNEARAALQDIMLGRSVREVHDQNGERLIYSPSNLSKLQAYISWLEVMAGVKCYGGPAKVVFR